MEFFELLVWHGTAILLMVENIQITDESIFFTFTIIDMVCCQQAVISDDLWYVVNKQSFEMSAYAVWYVVKHKKIRSSSM